MAFGVGVVARSRVVHSPWLMTGPSHTRQRGTIGFPSPEPTESPIERTTKSPSGSTDAVKLTDAGPPKIQESCS